MGQSGVLVNANITTNKRKSTDWFIFMCIIWLIKQTTEKNGNTMFVLFHCSPLFHFAKNNIHFIAFFPRFPRFNINYTLLRSFSNLIRRVDWSVNKFIHLKWLTPKNWTSKLTNTWEYFCLFMGLSDPFRDNRSKSAIETDKNTWNESAIQIYRLRF